MTIRNLQFMFKPRSIALIGASMRPGSVGSVLAHNLFNSGFEGPVMPVNPKHEAVAGVLAYPNVAALPHTPDLAVISTPPDAIPGIVAELGNRGTRAAVIISAGFRESREQHGKNLRQDVLDAAKPYCLRVIGPNCLGIMMPGIGLNASFAPVVPQPGKLAFVTQSGAIASTVASWAAQRNIGFSHLVSLGNMTDVDFGDMLDYLANDPHCRAVLMYIEAVASARKFISAARAAARTKPVIVVKAGRHSEGAKAVASHTGALAGSDAVYEAVFRRAGMLRVFSLDELFDAVETLAMCDMPKGNRLAILTNGGGIGILATDALIDEGGCLADLSPETIERLNQVLPPTWSHGNPVDIVGDATGSRYGDTLSVLLEDKTLDAVLGLNCPTAVASVTDAAQAVIETTGDKRTPPLLTSWVGDGEALEARRLFRKHRIPTYDSPGPAARAFMYLVNYKRSQELLMETPPSIPEDFSPDTVAARAVIDGALAAGRTMLTEPEAKKILDAYGIPIVSTQTVKTPEEAATIAAQLAGPVAIKVLSEDISHKSDVGGVALDVVGPAAARDVATDMLERIADEHPKARLQGLTVQVMVRRPRAYELIVGIANDAQFGPVILFGHGGTAVEVIDDKALGLPPLNMKLAREMIYRTRIYRQLRGYRDRPPVNINAVALTLLKIAQIAIDLAEVLELDINPLLADDYGVMALDARIRIGATSGETTARLAIRPYPKELEETIPLADGRKLLLRPVVPEDEPSLQAAFAKLTPEEIRLRFFIPMKTMSHVMAARFTQIDYDREMALILTETGIPGKTEIFGVVRIGADPDNEKAEYDIIVREDMTGMGLGVVLMRRIIDYARDRGIGEIFGDVLRENRTMLKLSRALGFTQSSAPDEPTLVRVTLRL